MKQAGLNGELAGPASLISQRSRFTLSPLLSLSGGVHNVAVRAGRGSAAGARGLSGGRRGGVGHRGRRRGGRRAGRLLSPSWAPELINIGRRPARRRSAPAGTVRHCRSHHRHVGTCGNTDDYRQRDPGPDSRPRSRRRCSVPAHTEPAARQHWAGSPGVLAAQPGASGSLGWAARLRP